MTDTAIVLASGEPVESSVRAHLPDEAFVIVADSGIVQAEPLGLSVDLVVGDLDSIAPAALAAARDAGSEIERHPIDKDATDLELAVLAAKRRGLTHVIVVGGSGGRFDHVLATALALGSKEWASLHVEAYLGAAKLAVGRATQPLELRGVPGELCTLLAVGDHARGVTTSGLRFRLADEDLAPGSSRGVSNEFEQPRARVTVRVGTLLAIQPTFGRA